MSWKPMFFRGFITLVLAVQTCGCGTQFATQEDVDRVRVEVKQLEKRRKRQQRKLNKLLKEVKRQECRAEKAKIQSEIAVEHMKCVKDVARYEACVASNAGHNSNATLGGCAVGLLATFFTSGGATSWAIAGCAAGRAAGAATERECGKPPDCTKSYGKIHKIVLKRHGLRRLPRCK